MAHQCPGVLSGLNHLLHTLGASLRFNGFPEHPFDSLGSLLCCLFVEPGGSSSTADDNPELRELRCLL